MVQIVCTKQLTTGGAELLHQLCYELNSIEVDSNMIYYFRKQNQYIESEINQSYRKYCKYNLTSKLEDLEGNIIVFPETMAYLARKVVKAKVVIWWLSIDNYLVNFNYDYYKANGFKSTLSELKKLGRRPSFEKLKEYSHIVQSQYGLDFLKAKGIDSDIVSDYINTDFNNDNNKVDKENIICYNPKKGLEVTKKIIDYYTTKKVDITFIPIVGMNSEGVKNLMKKSKIYIDFGGHPGKDRMPREARIQDCVIITGKRGSANNTIDITINKKYKINEKEEGFINKLDGLIADVVCNFDFHLKNQEEYKLKILNEKKQFAYQVQHFVNNNL